MSAAEVLASLRPEQLKALGKQLSPKLTAYIPHSPTVKQAAFLLLPHREAFYGGSGGGGKSDALLMGALAWVDRPDFSALIVRKTYAQLSKAGALIPRSHEWLQGTDAEWNGSEKKWRFPSGATLEFGYLQTDTDRYNYQGAHFDYIAFDELTDFGELTYRFLFSRLRRRADSDIPSKIRGASNPGGKGHEWVKGRFVDPGSAKRPFVPARIDDNPYLDQEGYRESLSHLDPVTRRQIEQGDWSARSSGGMFHREMFEIVDQAPAKMQIIRYWDLGATEPTNENDPDWTRGCAMGRHGGLFYILDVAGIRAAPGRRDRFIRQRAELDGLRVAHVVEQEPGSGGKFQAEHISLTVLAGFTASADRPTGDKVARAGPLASQADAGNVKLLRGEWNEGFLDEIEAFPEAAHDDQVDSASGALGQLCGKKSWGFEDLYAGEPEADA